MTPRLALAVLLAFCLCLAACSAGNLQGDARSGAGDASAGEESATGSNDAGGEAPARGAEEDASMTETKTEERATLGAGCFWCVEAVFERLDGVSDVSSGYMGGHVDNPTYRQICTGRTGHAEVVQVTFDPRVISYEKLLDWFWKLHDPTTLNRQGPDSGTQYRSAIFYHSEAQREAAEKSRRAADASGDFPGPIVTEITAASRYYEAEDYHQDYYEANSTQPYCRAMITPKLEKLGLDEAPRSGER